MNSIKLETITKTLAALNGPGQDIFVLEEMSELQKELMKHRRGKDNRDQIVDECVDVLLTIQILLRVYKASGEEVHDLMQHKLNRLRGILPKTIKE